MNLMYTNRYSMQVTDVFDCTKIIRNIPNILIITTFKGRYWEEKLQFNCYLTIFFEVFVSLTFRPIDQERVYIYLGSNILHLYFKRVVFFCIFVKVI